VSEASGGPVFGDGAGRAVDVDGAGFHDVFVVVVGESQFVSMSFDPGESNFDTFFKHVAEFASQLHAAGAGHLSDLDEQDATLRAGAVCHEACDDTGLERVGGELFLEAFDTEDVSQVVYADRRRVGGKSVCVTGLSILDCFSTANAADLALEIRACRM